MKRISNRLDLLASATSTPISCATGGQGDGGVAQRAPVDLDAMIQKWRSVAGDVTHMPLPQQRLELEVRQAKHALNASRRDYAQLRDQSRVALDSLREENESLRAALREAMSLSLARPVAPVRTAFADA